MTSTERLSFSGAGLLNALEISGKTLESAKIVINGAGASAIACADIYVALGADKSNIIMCDSRGVIYKGRMDNMNEWKEEFASDTPARTLAEALVGADVLIGLSVAGAISQAIGALAGGQSHRLRHG